MIINHIGVANIEARIIVMPEKVVIIFDTRVIGFIIITITNFKDLWEMYRKKNRNNIGKN